MPGSLINENSNYGSLFKTIHVSFLLNFKQTVMQGKIFLILDPAD